MIIITIIRMFVKELFWHVNYRKKNYSSVVGYKKQYNVLKRRKKVSM